MCYMEGVQTPHLKGQFWWIGAPIVKYRYFLPFRLWTRVGRRMHKFIRIRQVAPMCRYGRTHCRQLVNAIEPSVNGSDAPYVKLLWPLVIFGHAHLGSCTDSQVLGAEYCIMGIPHKPSSFISFYVVLCQIICRSCPWDVDIWCWHAEGHSGERRCELPESICEKLLVSVYSMVVVNSD